MWFFSLDFSLHYCKYDFAYWLWFTICFICMDDWLINRKFIKENMIVNWSGNRFKRFLFKKKNFFFQKYWKRNTMPHRLKLLGHNKMKRTSTHAEKHYCERKAKVNKEKTREYNKKKYSLFTQNNCFQIIMSLRVWMHGAYTMHKHHIKSIILDER